MKITDTKTLHEVQMEFSKLYPGLKIEFYSEEHDLQRTSPSTQQLDTSNLIGDVRDIHETQELVIKPNDTVGEIEGTLKNLFGLNVQIFRKSKELWLQTSATDGWTIEKQNLKGLHSMQ